MAGAAVAVVVPPNKSGCPESMSRRLISFAGSAFGGCFLSSSESDESSFLADEIPEKSAFFICSFFSSTTGFGGSGFLFKTDVAGVEVAEGVKLLEPVVAG